VNSKHTLTFLFCLTTSLFAQVSAAPKAGIDRQTVADVLGFEEQTGGPLPVGWSGTPSGTVSADKEIVHSGKWSARMERNVDSANTFTTLTKSLSVDFLGKEVQLRGFLRTSDVKGYATLWLREDGEGSVLRFVNMQKTNLQGTTPWTEYSVILNLVPDARRIVFGALIQGTGTAWVDDLHLLVDGKPIAEAAAAPPRPVTVLDRVHDFDRGSGVSIESLNEVQTKNLVTLGRVWGFLKYHHPAVTSGQSHWDYELLSILPDVLKASSQSEAQAAIVRWIDRLGPVTHCGSCSHLELANLSLKPDLAWLRDQKLLGSQLSSRLKFIYENRPSGNQFYVSRTSIGNPQFDHELLYVQIKLPDPGFQLLALYRFWNIMQYWSPNRDIAGQDWPKVLREFIPRIALAKSSEGYELAMMALIAKANDTHTNLWSSIRLRPPTGKCQFPVNVRFINNQAAVTSYADPEVGPSSGFMPGDIVEQIDGQPVVQLLKQWRPLYADSNEAARLRDTGQSLTQGECGAASVVVRRGKQKVSVHPVRVEARSLDGLSYRHDLPGDTFRLLTKEIAYLKLSSVKASDISKYMEQARNTKGMIVDIRNYPSEFVPFALGQFLVTQSTPFVRFTFADFANPGAFIWGQPVMLQPAATHYGGKVVVLVDEITQSQAEYTTMALQSSPNAIVVGSTTAGADGNVSEISLPGNLNSMISGLGIYYPNKTPTQRIGVRLDIRTYPTISGIKSGRDEALETAIRQIVGPALPASEIEQLVQR
jgi:C-terminal processing protease CtpA/Prc